MSDRLVIWCRTCDLVLIGGTFSVIALAQMHRQGTGHDFLIEMKEGADGVRLERAQREAG